VTALHGFVIRNDGDTAKIVLSDGTPLEMFRNDDKTPEEFLADFPAGDVADGTFELCSMGKNN
jgi:hypothetical protein